MTNNRQIDTEGVRERINIMIDDMNIKAADFANETTLPRTTVSNILNGKTNATIEVLNKIMQTYPKWSAAWLLFGLGGKMESGASLGIYGIGQSMDLFDGTENQPNAINEEGSYSNQTNANMPSSVAPQDTPQPVVIKIPPKEIEKIMVFYNDKSFQTFIAETIESDTPKK